MTSPTPPRRKRPDGSGPAHDDGGAGVAVDSTRDEEGVRHFVERFALTLSNLGFPRMSARVLGTLMVAVEPGLTAGQIGQRLGVSAAAVSGAVRYLVQVGMVAREPVPGSRSDRYRLPDDPWYLAGAAKSGVYKRVADLVQEGVVVVGDETSPSGARLAEMRDFMLFIQDSLVDILDRWERTRTP
jgi:DNA-binding transcriptional regulator GbsR (MarR family)